MTEDVSAQIRLATTIVSLAALVAVVLHMTVIGQDFMNSWFRGFQTAIHNSENTVMHDLVSEKKVTAAVAYKYIASIDDAVIETLEIKFLDGSTYYDEKYLLENANKSVKMSVTGRAGERMSIKIEEVD